MKYTISGVLYLLLFCPLISQGQVLDSLNGAPKISSKLSAKYVSDMTSRSEDYKQKMQVSTEKYLEKLKNQEEILKTQLAQVNPDAATRIFENSTQTYNKIEEELHTNAENITKSCGRYVAGIDSAITSLKYLQQSNLTGKLGNSSSQIGTAMSKIQSLQIQFQKTDNIEDFIKQREIYLQQQLSNFNLSGLQQYQRQAAFYAQQMEEYKEAWQDPTKMEAKAVTALNKIPAFQTFMQKNSMIAGLFNLPQDYNSAGVGGLQTKDQVQKIMQQQMLIMGPSGSQTAQTNIGDGQTALSSLRTKLNLGGSSDLAMPNNEGDKQHTKTFLKRIEYGVNVQSIKANSYWPNETDFAVTAAYKLNDNNSIGIGVAYNVGWGQDIQHISITSRGIGIRSFGDFKIKGSFYGSVGFEYNYNQPFVSINQLKIPGIWQESGLIGVTKMVSLNGKIVKKTKLQLLWNFLSSYQIPKGQPIVFRVGYNFN